MYTAMKPHSGILIRVVAVWVIQKISHRHTQQMEENEWIKYNSNIIIIYNMHYKAKKKPSHMHNKGKLRTY